LPAVEGRRLQISMRSLSHVLVLQTQGRGLVPFTEAVQDWVTALSSSGAANGLLTAFCRHTSASLLVQENADPEVLADLDRFFSRLVPDGDALFRHTAEGSDDMPAHVRAALTQVHLSIPVVQGQLMLGTWQGMYLFEHRRRPHRREVVLQYLGS
jgi:secondary thiamine-phosphate synthase enzyme